MPVPAWWDERHVRWRASGLRAEFASLLLAVIVAQPVQAQVSGQIAATSDERWRGRSVASGRPAATAAIGYDHGSGVYADASLTGAALQGGPALVSAGVDLGYAWRLRSGLAIDLGATRREFLREASVAPGAGYSEVYAGLSGRSLSGRVHYSPDYLRRGVQTLYATLDAVARPHGAWRLLGHVGVMQFLTTRPYGGGPRQIDYGAGVARRLGPVVAELRWSGGGPGKDYYGWRARSRQAVTIGLAWSF